jgi:uncharacterized protein (DUF433 family)
MNAQKHSAQLKIMVAEEVSEPRRLERKNPTTPALTSSPDVMHGALVLGGTRIPVAMVLDELIAGGTIADFVEGHPSISCGDVEAALLQIRDWLEEGGKMQGTRG